MRQTNIKLASDEHKNSSYEQAEVAMAGARSRNISFLNDESDANRPPQLKGLRASFWRGFFEPSFLGRIRSSGLDLLLAPA
jgi:hypothetical protein